VCACAHVCVWGGGGVEGAGVLRCGGRALSRALLRA
jgi:hypothetical protein